MSLPGGDAVLLGGTNPGAIMTYEEMAIVDFLRGFPDTHVARREIARKVLKRTVFEDNPHWADAPLTRLVEQRVIEQNESGHYRVRRAEP